MYKPEEKTTTLPTRPSPIFEKDKTHPISTRNSDADDIVCVEDKTHQFCQLKKNEKKIPFLHQHKRHPSPKYSPAMLIQQVPQRFYPMT